MTSAMQMRKSWLVQRLNSPREGFVALGKDNPFSFGGGLRNGGLSPEAMDLLRPIFSFDYMGSAEFEFGAVPEALQGMAAKDVSLRGFTLVLLGREVFVICREQHVDEVSERLTTWADNEPRLKEPLRFSSALRSQDDRTIGWLELNNGFFFFTDRKAWEGTCKLFDVKI